MPPIRGIYHGGGRKPGIPNKIGQELRDAARKYTPAALQTLMSIMTSSKYPAAARVMAATELLNRGHGRAPQSIAIDFDAKMEHRYVIAPPKMSREEWDAHLAEIRSLPREQQRQKILDLRLEQQEKPLANGEQKIDSKATT